MTGATIGDAFDCKLAFVLVFMTCNAFKMHAGILHRQRGRFIRAHMTFIARDSRVPVFQRKACPVMREDEFLPRLNAVAGFTPIRHFLIELAFVYIFMTGRA
jgi:hypothetical protein